MRIVIWLGDFRAGFSEPDVLNVAQMGTSFSSYGPTPTHERSLDIAEQEFAGIKTALERIFTAPIYPRLRRAMDEAGVPWTPGRGVPGSD